jgi:hypothetical protein
MSHFITPEGAVYVGDMRLGDREATEEEVGVWELARQPAPLEQIRLIERTPAVADAMQRGSRLVALSYAIDELIRVAASKGQTITRQQAHDWSMLNDGNYATLYNAEQVIKPLRLLV